MEAVSQPVLADSCPYISLIDGTDTSQAYRLCHSTKCISDLLTFQASFKKISRKGGVLCFRFHHCENEASDQIAVYSALKRNQLPYPRYVPRKGCFGSSCTPLATYSGRYLLGR